MDKREIVKILSIQSPKDKAAYAKIIDVAEGRAGHYGASFTDFTDPHKAESILNLFNRKQYDGLKVKAYGGILFAERTVLGFYDGDINDEIQDDSFPITRIKLTYQKSHAEKISHRDFLGALMGLSVDRGKFGEIIIQDEYAFVLLKQEISDFVMQSLFSVGKMPVSCEIVDYMEINGAIGAPVQKSTSTASLRLDGIVAHCFNVSRGQAASAIISEKVFVNWSPVKSNSHLVSEGDFITIRGTGRIKILSLSGRSKKDRYVIDYLAY